MNSSTEQLDAAGSDDQISVPLHPMTIALELGAESVAFGAFVSPFNESSQLVFGEAGLQDLSSDVAEVSSYVDTVALA